MATVPVEIRPNEFADFEIAGDEPTYVEMQQIQRLVRDMERSNHQLGS